MSEKTTTFRLSGRQMWLLEEAGQIMSDGDKRTTAERLRWLMLVAEGALRQGGYLRTEFKLARAQDFLDDETMKEAQAIREERLARGEEYTEIADAVAGFP